MSAPRILRLREVVAQTRLSRSTLYSLMKKERFPRPIPLGVYAVGWLAHEVDAYLAQQTEARDRQLAAA